MNEVSKETIEAHKKAYKDLVLWINSQFENEISILLLSAKMQVTECFSRDHKELIKGAYTKLVIKQMLDSDILDYLCQALGSKRFTITPYPLGRIELSFFVPITNQAKGAMTATGMWVPYWRKENEQKKA